MSRSPSSTGPTGWRWGPSRASGKPQQVCQAEELDGDEQFWHGDKEERKTGGSRHDVGDEPLGLLVPLGKPRNGLRFCVLRGKESGQLRETRLVIGRRGRLDDVLSDDTRRAGCTPAIEGAHMVSCPSSRCPAPAVFCFMGTRTHRSMGRTNSQSRQILCRGDARKNDLPEGLDTPVEVLASGCHLGRKL